MSTISMIFVRSPPAGLRRLDAENEYFHDTTTNKLYLWYNGTGSTPPSSVVVPTLADMIVVNGSKAAPVQNITLGPGLQLRDNRPTYMEPRTNPSGGDWVYLCQPSSI